MSPAQWGPPTWLFLHALVEKIDESHFPDISIPLFNIVSQICKNLPCPECASHATVFMNSVKMNTIQTKENFKMMLFYFHNKVNLLKKKPTFIASSLDKYATVNLPIAFSMFVSEYTKKPVNFKLMTDASVRRRIINNTTTWLNENKTNFC
jgi:hypothetical protein